MTAKNSSFLVAQKAVAKSKTRYAQTIKIKDLKRHMIVLASDSCAACVLPCRLDREHAIATRLVPDSTPQWHPLTSFESRYVDGIVGVTKMGIVCGCTSFGVIASAEYPAVPLQSHLIEVNSHRLHIHQKGAKSDAHQQKPLLILLSGPTVINTKT